VDLILLSEQSKHHLEQKVYCFVENCTSSLHKSSVGPRNSLGFQSATWVRRSCSDVRGRFWCLLPDVNRDSSRSRKSALDRQKVRHFLGLSWFTSVNKRKGSDKWAGHPVRRVNLVSRIGDFIYIQGLIQGFDQHDRVLQSIEKEKLQMLEERFTLCLENFHWDFEAEGAPASLRS